LICKQLLQPSITIAAIIFLFFPRFSVGTVPYIEIFSEYAKQWPNAILSPESEYIRESALGQIIFRILPVDGFVWFGLLHGYALVFGFVFLFLTIRNEIQSDYLYPVFRIILLGQVGYVLFRWIGSYDAFTFLLWGAFFYFASKRFYSLALILAFGLGFQHFEQTSIALLGMLIASNYLKGPSIIFPRKFILLAAGASIFGKVTLLGILLINGHSVSGRSNYLKLEIFNLGISEVINNLPVFLWSLFGSVWLLLFVFVSNSQKNRNLIPSLMYFLFCVAVAISARDHTRVFVLTTFPTLFFLTLNYLKTATDQKRNLYYLEVATWVTVPLALWENNLLGNFNLFSQISLYLTK
jgi:hypothetical protein